MMAGPEDDDEQRREDAADEREQHLDRRLGRHLLGALAALDPELLGLDLEHLGDRHAELLGLDDRADEVGQRRDLGARDDVAQGLAAGLPDAHLGERPAELVGQRSLELLDHLAERGVKAETGADRDRQQVERVRDHEQDRVLPCPHLPAQPELRDDVAEQRADRDHQEADDRRQAQDVDDEEQEEEDRRPDDRADRLDAEPIGHPHVARVAGQRQASLRGVGEGRARHPLHAAGEPGHERAQGALDERLPGARAPRGSWPASTRAGSGVPGPDRPASCRSGRGR